MRLLTRSDFDGLACGALLLYLQMIDDWKFVHPKDIQDGLVDVSDKDILANIPYVKGCKLWFDHHSSETERLGTRTYFEGVSRVAPSCARVIYDYYGGDAKLGRFARMIEYVDKVDSGNLTRDEILDPKGWVLLGFVMDPRTGLGRFRNFTISNYDLMKKLARACAENSIDQILEMDDVKERLEIYFSQAALFQEMIKSHAKVEGNAVIVDLRNTDPIYAGNRFLIYTLYPEQNISIWVIDGRDKLNTAITVGYSILKSGATVNVGRLLYHYGGGGHNQVGTCQVDNDKADGVIREILDAIK
ncbi:MAG: exopolyphosphatase [Treponema sp.]|jgi:nanoRNase/pAp phosphatase (c-di-AMP/oligoRNAs hydrolase)|nr:exopolyphosphatase [Treponema sp.]